MWNTKFYRLEGIELADFHRHLDSIAAINHRYAIIHIWNYTLPYPSLPNIYFNDSLVGTSYAPTGGNPGHRFEIHELDLRFATEGTLSLTRQRTPRSSRHLEVGKTYIMAVFPPKEGFYFSPSPPPIPACPATAVRSSPQVSLRQHKAIRAIACLEAVSVSKGSK